MHQGTWTRLIHHPTCQKFLFHEFVSTGDILLEFNSQDHVANSSNSSLVRRHIISTFRRLNWDVEEDTFTEKTPYGATKFTNVIATKDPKAATKLVLSAHYDSKFFPKYPDNQVR